MRVALIAFIDVLFCMLIVVLFMISPDVKQKEILDPPGQLSVFTSWGNLRGDDVDTWMFGPDFKAPVGYDHKDSPVCTLVKDDLGIDADPSNFENIFCRVTPDGEYIINVYSYNVAHFPTDVYVKVILEHEVLFEEKVTLTSAKEEITVIRFKLKDGVLVPESVHKTPISLFDYRK